MIHSNIKRWGNSPALRIPATMMEALNLSIDDEVIVSLDAGKLTIERAVKEPVFDLNELVAGITPENLHDAVDWGKPVDGEIW